MPDHEATVCPLLDAPKPHMLMYGHADEQLVFFEFPATKSYKAKLESTRLGMLSVEGGELNIPQIVSQLKRLVPIEGFQWDVRQVGHYVFKVAFPSKEELERMCVFGTFQVPNSVIKITFEHWTAQIEPTCLLPEVWVKVAGLPPKRRENFLGLWGLGTMFGKTLKVDMPYLREHGVARLLIGCLDYTRIPDKWNIFVVDGFYELSFEVETPEDDPEMEESQTEKGANNDDDDPNAKKYEGPKDAPKDQDEVDQATPMEATYDVPNNQSVGQSVPSQQADRSVQAKGVIFSPSLKRDIEESKRLLRDMFISDQGVHDISKIESDAGSVGAVEAVPSSVAVVPTEKCEVAKTEAPDGEALSLTSSGTTTSTPSFVSMTADMVLTEDEGRGVSLSADVCLHDAVHEISCAGVTSSDAVHGISDVGVSLCAEPTWAGQRESFEAQHKSPMGSIKLSEPFMGDKPIVLKQDVFEASPSAQQMKPTRKDIIAYGGIQDPSTSSPRSSQRISAQTNADSPQMERAMLFGTKER
jgi:hypothetical protein